MLLLRMCLCAHVKLHTHTESACETNIIHTEHGVLFEIWMKSRRLILVKNIKIEADVI